VDQLPSALAEDPLVLPARSPWMGRTMPAGDVVPLAYAAAHRGPGRFPEPDRFDITRTPNLPSANSDAQHHQLALRRLNEIDPSPPKPAPHQGGQSRASLGEHRKDHTMNRHIGVTSLVVAAAATPLTLMATSNTNFHAPTTLTASATPVPPRPQPDPHDRQPQRINPGGPMQPRPNPGGPIQPQRPESGNDQSTDPRTGWRERR
jgi:hypothetical protein